MLIFGSYDLHVLEHFCRVIYLYDTAFPHMFASRYLYEAASAQHLIAANEGSR